MIIKNALLCILLLFGCAERPSQPVSEDLQTLFSIPLYRNPLEPQTHEKWRERDRIIEKVSFQGRFGDRIPALVVYSELAYAQALPVLLCMPGTPNVKEDLLNGLNIMRPWADRGFFVISIDRPYHGQREGNLEQNILEKGMVRVWGESLYDLMATLDYVESRKEADGHRIGMLGLSMGGMEALWLAALDGRIGAVVSVAGHLTWQEIFRSGAWMQIFRGYALRNKLVQQGLEGEEARRAFFQEQPGLEAVGALNMVDRLVPRPLLLMVGDQDPFMPLDASEELYGKAKAVYARRGYPTEERVGLFISEGDGHSFTKPMQRAALDWFIRWLVDPVKTLRAD